MKTTKTLWNKLFQFGFLLSLGATFFIGCISTGGGALSKGDVPPGTLTITGIPADYEGKYLIIAYDPLMQAANEKGKSKALSIIPTAEEPKELSLPPDVAGNKRSIRYARTGALIKDGEASMSVYIEVSGMFKQGFDGYTGSDTVVDVGVCIVDTALPERKLESSEGDAVDFRLDAITFENGSAAAVWGDPLRAGSITITGIPSTYQDKSATVRIGYEPPSAATAVGGAAVNRLAGLSGALGGGGRTSNHPQGTSEASGTSSVRGGTATVKFFGREQEPLDPKKLIQTVKYRTLSYTETGTKDVMVSILIASDERSLTYENFLFKDVQFTDGKAESVDFSAGVKQKQGLAETLF